MPCTAMLTKMKIHETASVLGLTIPRIALVLLNLSVISVVPTFSDFTREMARSFSSCVSHLASCGWFVRVKKAMREMPTVMSPSTRKSCSQPLTLPIPLPLRMPDASRPPKAPASGAVQR